MRILHFRHFDGFRARATLNKTCDWACQVFQHELKTKSEYTKTPPPTIRDSTAWGNNILTIMYWRLTSSDMIGGWTHEPIKLLSQWGTEACDTAHYHPFIFYLFTVVILLIHSFIRSFVRSFIHSIIYLLFSIIYIFDHMCVSYHKYYQENEYMCVCIHSI